MAALFTWLFYFKSGVTLKTDLLLKLVGSAHSVEILDGHEAKHGYTEPADIPLNVLWNAAMVMSWI